LAEDHSSPKHSGVRALFDQHWIAPGRLPKEMGRLYRQLFDSRQKSDYADLVTSESLEIQAWVGDANVFVRRIAEAIEQAL
jgi:uncharacterized protein (UPF0332 family)